MVKSSLILAGLCQVGFWSKTSNRVTSLPEGGGIEMLDSHTFRWHRDSTRCFFLKTGRIRPFFYPMVLLPTWMLEIIGRVMLMDCTYEKNSYQRQVQRGSSDGQVKWQTTKKKKKEWSRESGNLPGRFLENSFL